eukprot:TRINITY_DN852_c0_g1_i1.p1 TRINITY_DN852_c0_g1~~TRINITY_DN852_c0_g1_i1.p1  ORF type:complete len:223 (+),score=35.34 TRINITY_DN852_c0_g1_i1:47-715(+)
MGKSKKDHIHTCATAFFALCTMVFAIVALSQPWYEDLSYNSATQLTLVNVTYSFQNVVTSVGSLGGPVVKTDSWDSLAENNPQVRKVYQTSQTFTLITLITSAVVAALAILIGCFKCAKGLRKFLKMAVRGIALAAFIVAVVSWATFFMVTSATKQDAEARTNGKVLCTTGACVAFRDTTTTSALGITGTHMWGPIIGFWLMIAASGTALIAFAEIIRDWRS